MEDRNSIVALMNQYKKEHGLSQRELAELLGCSQSAVSQWLNKKRTISTEYLLTFQRLLENK